MSLAVLQTVAGYRCTLPGCPQGEKLYHKLAGLASHGAFVHGLRSTTPYRRPSTRRGLDRKAGDLDVGRLSVLAAIPKMHAPPLERIIPDARPKVEMPVLPGEMQHIRRRVDWTVAALAGELRVPIADVKASFAIIFAPPKGPLPRISAVPNLAPPAEPTRTVVVHETREYVISVCPDCRERRKPAREPLNLEPLPFVPPVFAELSA